MALIFFFLSALFALAQAPHPCAACHVDVVADFKTHEHAKRGMDCAICHGASEKHRTSVGNAPPDKVAAPNEVSKLCGACHLIESQQYETSAHFAVYTSGKKVKAPNCTSCHGNHAVRPIAAQAANCQRCHTATPAACKRTPVSGVTRVSCMGCHARHTLEATGQ